MVIYFLYSLHTWMYQHPYPLHSGHNSCGETFCNTPQNNDDVTKTNEKNNNINQHLTIWRLVCIIFLFHIFSTFFDVPIFSLFLVFECDEGQEDGILIEYTEHAHEHRALRWYHRYAMHNFNRVRSVFHSHCRGRVADLFGNWMYTTN